jgi:predicted ATPase
MASPGPPERYRFESFELQPDNRRLLKDGATISLRPRAFDLLVALVDRAGHLVTKDELLDQVWPKMVVEEAVLHVQVSALRKILGADAITTVSGRGYQFTLPVTKGDGQADRASKPKHNLPYQLTSFVGREQEIAQLKELVSTNRLVTLTGAGGAGKTRLAIEVASQLIEGFPDGVWLVELAALSDPHLVPQSAAYALEVKEQPTRPLPETLSDYLASKKLLLVLDNVEHLLEGCGQFVYLILRRSPDVAVLVTGRERLGMAGELTYRVPSLTVPERNEARTPATISNYEGVRLFVERAKLLRPDFDVTTENASTVASICSRLDGMPLAIELAAPRLRSMTVEELSQRLDDRFAVLTGGSRTGLPRHRTLRSTIDRSYDLLTDAEQAMLRRVSVFAGGWTLAAAEHACTGDGIEKPDALGLLTSLVDKNLIVPDVHGGATRYGMLETIRQYALDRRRETGEEATWRGRHFAWILALAEESWKELVGPQQRIWIDRMSRELDNVRTALQWAIDEQVADAFRIAPNLALWWVRRASLSEARQWFTRLLGAIPHDCAPRDRARALSALGNMAKYQRDYEDAERMFRESLRLNREVGDVPRSVAVQALLGSLDAARGRYSGAELLLVECATFVRTLGDAQRLAGILRDLAIVVRARGDAERSASLIEESLALACDAGDSILMSDVLILRGRAECGDGNLESAEVSFVESLALAGEPADPNSAANALEGFAELAVARHAPKRAATILGAVARLREEIGMPISWVHEEREHERLVAATREAFGDDAFDQAWREGSAMDLENAVRYTLSDQVAGSTRAR